jgi:hypothetical protein
MERILLARAEPDRVDQVGIQQAARNRVDAQQGQQVGAETRSDHRRSTERALGSRIESVDASGDGGLKRRRQGDVADLRTAGVRPTVAV